MWVKKIPKTWHAKIFPKNLFWRRYDHGSYCLIYLYVILVEISTGNFFVSPLSLKSSNHALFIGCGACYVGETSRHICTRINEHLSMDKASHIFKHLQDSPRCRTLCSSECFVVIDQATTRTQLKIKEALHIHWEKPSLNQQLFHVNLNLSL